jgi:asparagine synthase (glutamine-hydrolysing)
MAHSLEVRVPLVDSTLLTRAAAIAASSGTALTKSLLAEAPSLPLPSAVVARAKTGFMTPVAAWQERRALSHSATRSERGMSAPWARTWARLVMALSGGQRCAA